MWLHRFIVVWALCGCTSAGSPARTSQAPGLSSGGGQGAITSTDAGTAADAATTSASGAGDGSGGTADSTVGTDDTAETSDTFEGGDAGGTVDASPPADAGAPDVAITDAGSSDADTACKQGDQGCQGNNIVQCNKGNWLAVQPCAPGTQCTLATDSTGAITATCKVLACGNGVCDAGESSATCPKDCPPPNPCGNGVCDAGESNATCPKDCPPPNPCGNGVCDAGESNATCPKDCPPPKPSAGCGSGTDPQFLLAGLTASGQVQNAYWSIVYNCVVANFQSQGAVCTATVNACIQQKPSPVTPKPSDACASCFASLGCCLKEKCLAQCASGPGSELCVACAQNAGCSGAWNACLAAKP